MAKKHIPIDDAVQRIELGKTMLKQFVRIDENRSRAFLDPSVSPLYTSFFGSSTADGAPVNITQPEIQADVPMGQSNLLTASLLVKVAVVSIKRPDFHVVATKEVTDPQTGETKKVSDPESAQIWRAYRQAEWIRKDLQRILQFALLKRYVCGLGTVSESWADNGFNLDHVQSWQLRMDPFVKNWNNPRYAGVQIRMSLTEAAERYINGPFKELVKGNARGDEKPILIEVYWDKDTEYHVYERERLIPASTLPGRDPYANLYERVPLRFLMGDQHPGKTPFPLGDSVLSAGSMADVSDLTSSVVNTAKHGVGLLLIDTSDAGLKPAQIEAVEKGVQQQALGVDGLNAADPPAVRIPGEELRPAVLEALRAARDDVLGIIGITQFDLGIVTDEPHLATTVAVTQQKGGARQNQAKVEYENFINIIEKDALSMFVEFGGPYKNSRGEVVASQEHQILYEAAQNITEICVIEGSTTYKDIGVQQQQSMQLLQLVMSLMPMMLQLAEIGLLDEVPDVKKLTNQVFRAFDQNQTDQLWVPAPKKQQGNQPSPDLIKALEGIYKDTPPDVRREIEAAFNLQPSQMGDMEEADDGGESDALKHRVDMEKQARDHLHESGLLMQKQMHEKELALAGHLHDQRMEKLKPKPTSNGHGKK
jgi:hypothetical protein